MTDRALKRAVLIIASVSSFLVPFMGSSVNIALPTIGHEFKIDAVLLSWVPTVYLLASALFLLPFGRMADIYGRKKIFLFGMITYTLGSLMCALSTSGIMLISCRGIQGIGIVTGAVYTGLALGPSLGGLLTEHLGWRSIFYLNVPLTSIVIVLVLWRLKGEWAEARGEHLDLRGSILYGLTLLLVMYGLSRVPSSLGFAFIVAGGIAVFTFFFVEGRTRSPVLDVRMLRSNPVFAFSNLAALIHYSSTYAVGFLMSLYLQYIKGLSAESAGIILISQPIVMALFSPLSGRLSDRIEPRVIASLGMALTCLGTFLLSLIGNQSGLTYIVFNLIILGFGFAFFSSPNTNAVMSSVERRNFGVASGTLGTMRLVGQMFSMGLALMIFSIFIGKVRITPVLYPLFLKSFKIAFVIFGSLCFFGIFSSLARGKVGPGVRERVDA